VKSDEVVGVAPRYAWLVVGGVTIVVLATAFYPAEKGSFECGV
jgi:hypothetical protein